MAPKTKVGLVSATALATVLGLAACSSSSAPAPSQSEQATSPTAIETPTASDSPSSIVEPLQVAPPASLGDKGLNLTVTGDQQTATTYNRGPRITISGGSITIEVRGTTAVQGTHTVVRAWPSGDGGRIVGQSEVMEPVEGGTFAKIKVNNITRKTKYLIYTVNLKSEDVPGAGYQGSITNKSVVGTSGGFDVIYEPN